MLKPRIEDASLDYKFRPYIGNVFSLDVGDVSQDGEDGESGENARRRIDETHDQRVLQKIVLPRIVRRQS